MDILREINLHLTTAEKDLDKSIAKIAMIGGAEEHTLIKEWIWKIVF